MVKDRDIWGADNVFLTFDTDWAHDDVLSFTADLLEEADVAATWFVTHSTPILERLRSNPKFELGIHPNFNFLLNGDFRNGSNTQDVVDRLLEIVPEAKSIRSHSLVQSSVLSNIFVQKNLRFESNLMLNEQSGIKPIPFAHSSGITSVPLCWGDYQAIINSRIKDAFTDLESFPPLRVFNFHPIHVFLNTEHINRYESSRDLHRMPEVLIEHQYDGKGTRTALIALLDLCG